MHEWEWVEAIAHMAGPPPEYVHATWQEDATVGRWPDRTWWVCSVDQLIEGVHFRRCWAPLDDWGTKAVLRSVSDLWVKGARPRLLWIALQVPPEGTPQEARTLYRGIVRACRRMGVYLTGGDTSRGPVWAMACTVIGSTRHPVLRFGARIGDRVWLTGPTGWAAAGVHLFERWRHLNLETPLITAWRTIVHRHDPWPASYHPWIRRALQAIVRPRLPVRFRSWMQQYGHASIDVSDGLLIDLWRVLRVNHLAAEIDAAAMHPTVSFARLCHRLGVDPWQWILTGGEDYAWIVVTAPDVPRPPYRGIRNIGRIIDGPPGEIRIRWPDGRTERLVPSGWDHWNGK